MSTVRAQLSDLLKPLLPKGWVIIPEQRDPGVITKTTVLLKQDKISKLPASPIGSLQTSFILTIVTPHIDTTRAEDDLDDSVLELTTALDSLNGVDWTEAQKVGAGEYLGYDISLSIITKKD
ncbi:hypothetical protein ASF48_06995 [Rathayibacter sp. Leaf299]|uniref:hypothetical protein n=1 Tax=Rathayibacter sp. Leaf299 TaxID=1736328 RepID=UPI0006F58761|nr:hypothetical protein [Rathayibacter sp. Leaf299]KQQ22877.1 hypothetical protein ASF48_06995 [Rathayibacter sp. Leaf299]